MSGQRGVQPGSWHRRNLRAPRAIDRNGSNEVARAAGKGSRGPRNELAPAKPDDGRVKCKRRRQWDTGKIGGPQAARRDVEMRIWSDELGTAKSITSQWCGGEEAEA